MSSPPQSMYNNLTQLRRMADRFAGKNHFAADSLQRQVAKLSSKFSRFENHLGERRRIVVGSLRFHTSYKEVCICIILYILHILLLDIPSPLIQFFLYSCPKPVYSPFYPSTLHSIGLLHVLVRFDFWYWTMLLHAYV